jgi:hypothetical protein
LIAAPAYCGIHHRQHQGMSARGHGKRWPCWVAAILYSSIGPADGNPVPRIWRSLSSVVARRQHSVTTHFDCETDASVCCNREVYFTEDGTPMTHEEMVALYHASSDLHAIDLADLYVDFAVFRQVEFMVFKDRLSMAVFLSRSTLAAAEQLREEWEDLAQSMDSVPDIDLVVSENREMASDLAGIARGAATLTSVAAFESLIDDLRSPPKQDVPGLLPKWRILLDQRRIPDAASKRLTHNLRKVAKRRNDYAHSLTGSYWPKLSSPGEPRRPQSTFSAEELEDTFFTVGQLAVRLESLIATHSPT